MNTYPHQSICKDRKSHQNKTPKLQSRPIEDGAIRHANWSSMWNVFHFTETELHSQVVNGNNRRRQRSVQATTSNHNIVPLKPKRRSMYASIQDEASSTFRREVQMDSGTVLRSEMGVVKDYSCAKPGRNGLHSCSGAPRKREMDSCAT